MEPTIGKNESNRTVLIVVTAFALAKLLIHLLTNAFGSYGIFRDEFYYLACAHHLDLGYVDQPPLSIYILAFNRLLFGESLFALRLLPAIAGAFTVFVVGLMARRLGGGTFAAGLACLAAIVSPIFLGYDTVYSMNCFDLLLWALGSYVVILVLEESKPQHWLILGVIIGLGLLNKISMGWFGAGLFVGLVATRHRAELRTRWPYIAAALAFLVFLPFIIWNVRHDFAHWEFMRNATIYKYSGLTPIDFILGQLTLIHPFALPVWLAGLFFFFFNERGKKYRMLGIIFVVTLLILVANIHTKAEYLAAAYSALFAAGGVQIEILCVRRRWKWVRYALPAILLIGGLLTAPLALPFLPVKTFIEYSETLGIKPESTESKQLAQLPQFYADMFGWENMAATISKVYLSLTPEERAKTVFWGRNYGQAGAIEYYSRKYLLPPAISPHNSYWIWGYGSGDYEVLIVTGGTREDLLQYFDQVEQPATIHCDYCMPYENNRPVFLCRKPKGNFRDSIAKIWPRDKQFV
jgi:hypothetical protein